MLKNDPRGYTPQFRATAVLTQPLITLQIFTSHESDRRIFDFSTPAWRERVEKERWSTTVGGNARSQSDLQ